MLTGFSFVLFSRQPSLHKMSMMSHRVKLMPYSLCALHRAGHPLRRCGIRKFTLRDRVLDWNQVQNILLWVPGWDSNVPIPAIIKPKLLWSGKQILKLSFLAVSTSREPRIQSPRIPSLMMTCR